MKRIFTLALLFTLSAQPAFAISPNDTFFQNQDYLNRIGAIAAWEKQTGSKNIIVAVIDTGIDLNHPDLVGNIWTNTGEIADDGIDNDGNGFIDDVHGWDFIDDDNSPSPDPDDSAHDIAIVSHGTAIAGVIGAVTNNNEGIAGINWDVQIMPIRVANNDGQGTSFDVRRAVEYAVLNGAHVMNLSFSSFDPVDAFLGPAIEEAYSKGVVTIAALGNGKNGSEFGVNVDIDPVFPACFSPVGGNEDWVIGVTALDSEDRKASFSNYGARCSDIAAPGLDVTSTVFHDTDLRLFDEPYKTGWSGTSIAAPMVAGAVALLKSEYASLTPEQIKTILQLSVDPVAERGTDATGKIGAGKLNIAKALQVAAQFADPNAPVASTPSPSPSTPTFTPSRSGIIALGQGPGLKPRVRIYENGEEISNFLAYAETFLGGIEVALGDVDADGIAEVITGARKGGGPHIRIFEQNGELIDDFFAYEKDSRTGVTLSVTDYNLDGKDDVIVSESNNGQGRIRVFEVNGRILKEFQPNGLHSAATIAHIGDINNDQAKELIFFRDDSVPNRFDIHYSDGTIPMSLLAYGPGFTKGISLALGDVNGDGVLDMITGANRGGGPHVRQFSGRGAPIGGFFAYDQSDRSGVMITTNQNNSIVTVPGIGGLNEVRVFSPTGVQQSSFTIQQLILDSGLSIAAW